MIGIKIQLAGVARPPSTRAPGPEMGSLTKSYYNHLYLTIVFSIKSELLLLWGLLESLPFLGRH